MQVKKLIKYISIGLVVFGILTGAGIYYASQKISTADIKQWTLEAINKTLPNATASLKEVTLSPGFNFELGLVDFSLDLNSTDTFKQNLMKVALVEAKIPIWSIITGSGKVSVSVEKPEIYFQKKAESNNWTYALGSGQTTATSSGSTGESGTKTEVDLKKILRGNSLDLSLRQINLAYELDKANSGKMVLDKFLVKNLNLNSETVFEISSQIKSKMGKDALSLDLLTVGQVNLAEYFEDKKVTGLLNTEVKNIQTASLKKKINKVQAETKFKLDKGVISGSLELGIDSFLKLNSDFSKNGEKIDVSSLKGTFSIKEIVDYINLDKSMRLSEGEIAFEGTVAMRNQKVYPDFKYHSTKNLKLSMEDKINLDASFKGLYKNFMFSVDSNNKLLNGTVQAKLALRIDPNGPMEPKNFGPVRSLVRVQGVHLKKDFIQKKLYGKTAKESSNKKSDSSEKTVSGKKTIAKSKPIILPMVNVNVKWNDVKFDNELFAGNFHWKGRGQYMKCAKCTFQFSKGRGSFDHDINLKNPDDIKINFISSLTGLNLNSLKPFLPPALDRFEGTFSGNVSGKVASSGKHNVRVDVRAKDGEVRGNKLGSYIADLVGNVPVLSSKLKAKNVKISDRFKTLDFKGEFSNEHYHIKKMSYVGAEGEKDIIVKGGGNLYPLNKSKRGIVDLTLYDNAGKLIKDMKKHIGKSELPMRLKGFGLDLKPDYAYTIKKVSKGALKTRGKKEAKKAIKKLLKGDKLKKVFKGLFK